MTDTKTRTIAVQVSEDTHKRFRMLRASTGMTSAEVVSLALERFTPKSNELTPDVLEDVRGFTEPTAPAEPDVATFTSEAERIAAEFAEFGMDPNAVAGNPFPT